MTITQLEYIIALNTHRNFAKAAKSCFVTQPTLSMQIKKLEEELNVIIFDRSKKPVLPTDIGKQILVQAQKAVRESQKILEIIKSEKEDISGELRIGIIPTLSPYLLPLFIISFMEKYPDVTLIVEELLSYQIVKKLNDDVLDVGIIVTPIKNTNLVGNPLFYERFVAYVSKNHPLAKKETIKAEELNLADLWLLKEGHCFRNQVFKLCGEELNKQNRKLRFESGSLETIKRLVDQKFGFTLLPELAISSLSELTRQNVRRFEPPAPVREVSLVIHRSYIKRKLISLLKEEILNNIPAALKDENRGKIIPWEQF